MVAYVITISSGFMESLKYTETTTHNKWIYGKI